MDCQSYTLEELDETLSSAAKVLVIASHEGRLQIERSLGYPVTRSFTAVSDIERLLIGTYDVALIENSNRRDGQALYNTAYPRFKHQVKDFYIVEL